MMEISGRLVVVVAVAVAVATVVVKEYIMLLENWIVKSSGRGGCRRCSSSSSKRIFAYLLILQTVDHINCFKMMLLNIL